MRRGHGPAGARTRGRGTRERCVALHGARCPEGYERGSEAALLRTRRPAWKAGGLSSTRMARADVCMAGWVAASRRTRDMRMTNRELSLYHGESAQQARPHVRACHRPAPRPLGIPHLGLHARPRPHGIPPPPPPRPCSHIPGPSHPPHTEHRRPAPPSPIKPHLRPRFLVLARPSRPPSSVPLLPVKVPLALGHHPCPDRTHFPPRRAHFMGRSVRHPRPLLVYVLLRLRCTLPRSPYPWPGRRKQQRFPV